MKIGIIGAGKVGCSLAQYFAVNNRIISGIYDTNEAVANTAATLLKTVKFTTLDAIIIASDILFLTVTDDAIETVWCQIADQDLTGKIICHCSGALSSAVFTDIEIKGAFGYSVHPVMTINHYSAVAELKKAPFTIEGSATKMAVITDLFTSAGNSVQILDAAQKIRYHAAAVFASNFMVGLAQISMDLLAECGFNEEKQQLFLPLMQASVENIVKHGVVDALTGPLQRGDEITLRKHLSDLTGDEHELYTLLSKKIITVAKQKNSQQNYNEIENIFTKNSDYENEK